jgi:hypothetical protein
LTKNTEAYILQPSKFPRPEVEGTEKGQNFSMDVCGFNPIGLVVSVTYADPIKQPKKAPYTIVTDNNSV